MLWDIQTRKGTGVAILKRAALRKQHSNREWKEEKGGKKEGDRREGEMEIGRKTVSHTDIGKK